MKFYPDLGAPRCAAALKRCLLPGALLLCLAFGARGELPRWMQDIVSGSAIESALYLAMDIPEIRILYPRPPAEARDALGSLLKSAPADTELYVLRAHSDEQALEFAAAESDWKLAREHAQDKPAAGLQLADFYHRRLRPRDEIAALLAVAKAPSPASEKLTVPQKQQAWLAFGRILKIADDQALPLDTKISTFRAWIERYPEEPSVYADLVSLLIQEKQFEDAAAEIGAYKQSFPGDRVFPLKASALIEYRRGSLDRALVLYESSFQPLWPQELVESYFSMLAAAHAQRRMLSEARAKLIENPGDLASAARIFYYYQREGRLDAARQAIDAYRYNKDRRKAPWSAEELSTFATLLDSADQYEAAARYYFALYAATDKLASGQSPQEQALTGLVRILLTAPDQGMPLGSGNLSIYSDIAAVDTGPGYLNGILSLWLNSVSPRREFHEEEQRGLPYFHRAKAAEILALLDQNFPSAKARAELHADLIRAYAGYGQDAAVIQAGNEFLGQFSHAPARVPVAMLMADAYARTNSTTAEFALYDRMLEELAANSAGMPLTASAASLPIDAASSTLDQQLIPRQQADAPAQAVGSALTLTPSRLGPNVAPDSLTYAQLLDRYLGRLASTRKLPEALAVLRRELDRNPEDPLLYERLADFLQQNNFSAQQEEVYRRAMERFKSRVWYDRLARLFIRERRLQDYSALSRRVVDTFRGTELEAYFTNATGDWPGVSLALNLYAHGRFPHDPAFTRNLLRAYSSAETYDPVAWETLMRQHWFESPDLGDEFFDYLSANRKLSGEIAALEHILAAGQQTQRNSAATRELAQADLWQSHFEQSAPLLGSLAHAYPADEEIGTEASSVYRSLAYLDPSQTSRAITIEKNLLAADPANLQRLARIGDIYADHASDDARQLIAALPYWRRIPSIHPGSPDGYLQAATIFWDYFQFDDALAEIASARKHFHDPSLFAYEAGAIRENQREPGKAVAEYMIAAIAGSAPAHDRLITLAARSAYSQLIDAALAQAAADSPTMAALALRADVLGAQKRLAEVAALVDSAVDRASTFDETEQLTSFARQRNLSNSYQRALRREVVLVADPVQRIDIQYALVNSLAAQDDIAAAEPIVASVYKENSKIIGVVRTTIDFYWEHKRAPKAIAILVQAAHDAYPELSRAYTLEAAVKSNENGDYSGARQLVIPLLDADPYGSQSAQCLSILADSYARAHDDAGLRDFYAARLAALKTAQMSSSDRRDQAALLRRGLILALTRLKDYADAVDQQIALISAFPEDTGVLEEAALYALRYDRRQQLIAFLEKTVADSPRDARFAIDLGRADTLFEDYPSAIESYGKAIAIRKDRSDIYTARAELEERLQRFDDACADYDKLYFLSYKDPQWMVRTAEARTRQGKNSQAVQALEAAWISGRPVEARNYFRVADQLDKWNLVDDASAYAQQGIKQAGDDLLGAAENHEGAAIYARILTRQRQSPQALKTLEAALHAADSSPSSPALLLQQAEKQGLAAVSDQEWRRNRVEQRRQQARAGFQRAVLQMSAAVATYFTPEEKLAYAKLLDGQRDKAVQDDVLSIWIPAAMAAGLKDREAEWRKYTLLNGSGYDQGQAEAFNLLEKQRMDNAERGRTLEKYADTYNKPFSDNALVMAEDAWRDATDHAKELSVLGKLDLQNNGQANLRERYFKLLLLTEPERMVEQASAGSPEYADSAANYLLQKGTERLGYAAIDTRAKRLQPVWHAANTALAGLYFADKSPAIDTAFRGALDDRNIGERVAGRLDTTRHLAGDGWFYYGMRYGVYRSAMRLGEPEDYLAAGLENRPLSAQSYAALAEAYAEAKDTAAALCEYGHALELAPDSASLHRAMALLLWSSGRGEEAVNHWQQALAILRRLVEMRAVPESFWIDFAAIAEDVRQRGLGQRLHPNMDLLLREYIAKNGVYRSAELLHSALIAAGSPEQGVDWILSLVDAARDPGAMLRQIDNEIWVPQAQRGRVWRRELALVQAAPLETGSDPAYLANRIAGIETRLIQGLIDEKKTDEAQALYDSLAEKQRQLEPLQALRIVLAAAEKQVPKLLAEFSSNPDTSPSMKTISAVASQLRDGGDPLSSRELLEYVFDFKAAHHELTDADFLSLAQARLDTGEMVGAVELLRRLTLVSPDLYSSLDAASGLLERSGHPAEAVPFLSALAVNTPWRPEYRLRLARTRITQKDNGQQGAAFADLIAVASSSSAGYATRVQAASELKGEARGQDLHSAELSALASGRAIAAAQADQPYFLPARVAAAAAATAAQRPEILRKAIAVSPSDSLRLGIFRAEFALQHDELAFTAIEPLLASPGGYVQADDRSSYPGRPPDPIEEIDQAGPESNPESNPELNRGQTSIEADKGPACGNVSPGTGAIDAAMPWLLVGVHEKVDFALAVVTLYERNGESGLALAYARYAAEINRDSDRCAEIARRVGALALRVRMESENAARRPVIHESLDQALAVRPRVTKLDPQQVRP